MIITNFKTKYKEGFIQSEIDDLLKLYSAINKSAFDSALMGITCIMINDELVIYRHDIEKALECGLENRALTEFEFD